MSRPSAPRRAAPALVLLTALLVGGVAMAPISAEAQSTAEENGRRPRVRFGISGVGGGFVGAVHGGLGGIAPRIGVQLGDWFAIYVQAQWLVGAFAPYPGDTHAAGFGFHELMFELTVADTFQIGGGPSLDYVWGCDENYGTASCARSGPYAGADFRAAIVLGNANNWNGRRTGVALSVDVHPTWVDRDFATVLLFGVGFELD